MAKKKSKSKNRSVKRKRKAAKANKKLITIVIAAAIIIGGVLGGLLYVNLRSAEKNAQNGDEFFAVGEYRKAYKTYGRAVSKEPANLVYIGKLEDTLHNIIPVTSDEAAAFYDSYLTALVHKSRYAPSNIDFHLEVAEELYKAAHLTDITFYWRRLQAAAESGYENISLDDPRRHELLLYVGLSSLKLENASMTDVYDDEGNIRFPGEDEIERVLEIDPGNEVAWAALAHGRLAVFYNLDQEGQTKQAQKNRRLFDETLQSAMEVAGDSFGVLIVFFKEAALQNAIFAKRFAEGNPATQEELDAFKKEVAIAQEKLIQAYNPSEHSMRIVEVISKLVSTQEGAEAANRLLEKHLEQYPKDFGRHYYQANILKQLGKFEEAEASALLVVESPQLTVSLEALEMFQYRPQAAQFLVELAVLQALDSDDELERSAYLAKAETYREILAELVSNNSANQLLVYADGLIALAEKRYLVAARLLEEVISKNQNATAQQLRYAASALRETGSVGLAIERLGGALQKEPSRLMNYILKARLELSISDYKAARNTLAVLSPTARQLPEVAALLDHISMGDPSSEATMFTDPILAVIAASEKLSSRGETEVAVAGLMIEIDKTNSEDWRLLLAMSNVYTEAANTEEAILWLKKAIEVGEDIPGLKNQLLLIENSNQVDSVIAIIKSKGMTAAEEATKLAVTLAYIGADLREESKRWNRVGNHVDYTSAKELSEKAVIESNKYQRIAEELGGDLSQILVLSINEALAEKDTRKAKELLEKIDELSSVDTVQMHGMQVSLELVQARIAKDNGDLAAYTKHMQIALDTAKSSTEEAPSSDKSWRMLGLVYSTQGNGSDALDANEKAYHISPKSKTNIRTYLGALLSDGKNAQRALSIIHIARKQYPKDKDLIAVWLEIEELYGNPEVVLAYREERYLVTPSDRMNAIKLAQFYINYSPEHKYLLSADGSQSVTARAWDKMPIAKKETVLRTARTVWASRSNDILAELSDDIDPDVRTCVLHTIALRDKGLLSEASSVWDRFIESREGTEEYEDAVITAADFLVKSERFIQAELLLKSARAVQGDTFAIDGALGDVFFTQFKFEEAAEAFKKYVEATKNPILHARMIEALIFSGQFEKAEKLLLEFATTNPAYGTAMLQATMFRVKSEQLLAQGDIDKGSAAVKLYRNALQAGIEADPLNLTPYFLLCRSLLSEYSLTQQKELLEEALQVIDKGEKTGEESEQFAVIRADVLQADGQLARAADRLAMYVENNPKANGARHRLMETYLDLDKISRAILTVEEGIEQFPADSLWLQRLGNLQMRANDNVYEAIKAYISAIEHEPSVRLLQQINLMTRTNKKLPDHDLLTMAQSDYSKLHPVAGVIEAKSLANLERRRDGLLAMEKAWQAYHEAIENSWIPPLSITEWFIDLHELFKDVPEEGEAFALRLANGNFTHEQYFGLAMYYKLFGNEFIDKAIDLIAHEAADPTLPKQFRSQLLNLLGGYLVEAGRFEESKSVYKQLVEEEKSPLVLNNYAYVVGVYMDNPQEGLRLAKEAVLQAPRNPSALDTVAVLYGRTGDYEKAAEIFDYLIQVDPTNTKAMAKLAILYAEKLNQPERGLVFAQRARTLTPRLPEVLDALGWSYYQTGREEQAEDLLVRSLRQGETMDAYIHLAQVVMNRDKFEDALGHLRMAQELADDTYSKKRISALRDDIRNIQTTVPE